MAQLSPEFYKKLLQVSSNVGMKPEDILIVMASESGLNPAAHNAGGDASGLIQFMPQTLKGLGFKGTPADFRNLSDVQQLDYVERLIKGISKFNGGPLTSAAQYYIGNFIPAALKIPGVRQHDPNTIICSKNPTEPHIPGVGMQQEASFYRANPSLDFDKDDNITYGDIENVLKRLNHNKNYQVALNDMHTHTNYKPDIKERSTENMVAQKDNILTNFLNKLRQSGKGMFGNKTITPEINDVLNRYLQSVLASEKYNKKLYKKYLPQNQAIICINSTNFTDSIEFGQVLCAALNEELLAKSFVHTNGNNVEVSVSIPGPEDISFEALKEVTSSIEEAFKQATKKIGGISIKTELITNKISSYQPINLKTAEIQHRKFLLKFI